MRLAKVGQNEHHKGPDANKECDDEQQNLPLWNGHVPEETPISTVRLDPTSSAQTTTQGVGDTYPTQPIIPKDFRCKEPRSRQSKLDPKRTSHTIKQAFSGTTS